MKNSNRNYTEQILNLNWKNEEETENFNTTATIKLFDNFDFELISQEGDFMNKEDSYYIIFDYIEENKNGFEDEQNFEYSNEDEIYENWIDKHLESLCA